MLIEDYGKGLDSSTVVDETLGMSLIKDLTRSLTDGTMQIDSQEGVRLIIQCRGNNDDT